MSLLVVDGFVSVILSHPQWRWIGVLEYNSYFQILQSFNTGKHIALTSRRSSFNPTYNKVIAAPEFLAVLRVSIVAQVEADKSDPVTLGNAEC